MSNKISSLRIRHEQYIDSFYDHLGAIDQLHKEIHQDLLPKLIDSLNLTPTSIKLVTVYLNDKINLFRFLSRHHFQISPTLLAISHSIQWRLDFDLDGLSPASLDPIYFDNPFLFFHSDLKDKFGRKSAILNLKYLSRSQDGGLNGLKEFLAWFWELARKSIYESIPHSIDLLCSNPESDSNRFSSSSSSSHPFPSASNIPLSLQVTLIVDLKDASMSNLELELLPYLLQLVKYNFPDLIGAIFILNYGWLYAGMWQVVKRTLTPATLDRIIFLSHTELAEFFDRSNLLVEHGGLVAHPHGALLNPFMDRFGRSLKSTLGDTREFTSHSRHPSQESIHDIFFSAVNTPRHQSSYPGTPHLSAILGASHRRHSGLNMTTYHPSQISSNSIAEGFRASKGFSSEWSQASLRGSNFQLKFPMRYQGEKNERMSQDDPSAAFSNSGRLSGFSSSSSLSEAGRQTLLTSCQHVKHDDYHEVVSRSEKDAESPRIMSYHKRKRDRFLIQLIIKFGYVFRTLQMLLRILTQKVINPRHHRRKSITSTSHDPGRDKYRSELQSNKTHNAHRLHHLHLGHLLFILNLQRKKMISGLGCLLFFLIFFKKKKP